MRRPRAGGTVVGGGVLSGGVDCGYWLTSLCIENQMIHWGNPHGEQWDPEPLTMDEFTALVPTLVAGE